MFDRALLTTGHGVVLAFLVREALHNAAATPKPPNALQQRFTVRDCYWHTIYENIGGEGGPTEACLVVLMLLLPSTRIDLTCLFSSCLLVVPLATLVLV